MAGKPVTWKQAISIARKAGLLSAWTKGARELEESGDFDYEPSENVGAQGFFELLQMFYGSTEAGGGTALKDGYLSHDWRYGQETNDIIAELSECAGKPGWFKLTKIGAADMLFFDGADGTKHELCGTNLQDVVEFFNERLRDCGADRQFWEVETDGDYFTFICLPTQSYESLVKVGIIPFVGCEPLVATPNEKKVAAATAQQEAWAQTATPGQLCDRARTYARANELDKALADYDRAVEKFKDMTDLASNVSGRVMFVVVHSERGKIHFDRKNFALAQEDFGIAADNANEPETRMMRGRAAYVMQGRALMELGRFDEAIASYSQAIAINEYDPDAYFYRGECRERMGKWVESKVDKLRAHTLGFRS